MRRCAAELAEARKVLAQTQAGMQAALKQVAMEKASLRGAAARRAVLKVRTSLGPTPGAAGAATIDRVVASIEARIQEGERAMRAERARFAAVLAGVESERPTREQVFRIRAGLTRLQGDQAAWRQERAALAAAARGRPGDLMDEGEELQDLEEFVIPSRKSSVATQEELIHSIAAAMGATRSRLQACLGNRTAHPQTHRSQREKRSSRSWRLASQTPLNQSSTVAAVAEAARSLDDALRAAASSGESDASSEGGSDSEDLARELEQDGPYAMTLKSPVAPTAGEGAEAARQRSGQLLGTVPFASNATAAHDGKGT